MAHFNLGHVRKSLQLFKIEVIHQDDFCISVLKNTEFVSNCASTFGSIDYSYHLYWIQTHLMLAQFDTKGTVF